MLRKNKFPPRYDSSDDFSNYLARVEDDEGLDRDVRQTAKQIDSMLELAESMGMLKCMRLHSAYERALEIYSPKANAPPLR